MVRIAVLDDWQELAAAAADWQPLKARADLTFFKRPFRDEDDAAAQLAPFEVLIVMRERTPFPRSLVDRLPNLKMFALTGKRGSTINFPSLLERGVTISQTEASSGGGEPTAELALGLMLAAARRIAQGDAAIRAGRFQEGVPAGFTLYGKRLGLIGLGRLGSQVARYCQALGMEVVAWSRNLTPARAAEVGVQAVDKQTLLTTSDVISVHMVLSDSTRNLIGAAELAAMKPGALLINTSRAGLIDTPALLQAVGSGRIQAAIDVFDREPLAPDAPIRTAPNTLLTPHIGYGSIEAFRDYYRQCVENVIAYLDGAPIRVIRSDPNKAK